MRCARRAAPFLLAWLPAVLALLSKAPLDAPARQPDNSNSDPLPGGGETKNTDSIPTNATATELQDWVDTEPEFTPEERLELTKGTNGTNNLCIRNRILPEVMVIGAYRGGTTSFCGALRYSPSILFPLARQHWQGSTKFPARWKEGHHFDQHLKDGIDYMLDDYGPCHRSVRLIGVDGTVAYSVEYRTPKRIKTWYGNLFQRLNFVFIMREPLSRLHSHYHYSRALGSCSDFRTMSFQAVVRQILAGHGRVWTGTSRSIHGPACGAVLEASLYVNMINRYFIYFDPSQFTFIPFQLIKDHGDGAHPAQSLWERLGARGLVPPALHMNGRAHRRLEDEMLPKTIFAMRMWFAEHTSPDKIAARIANTTAFLPGFTGTRDVAAVAVWILKNW